MIYLYSKPMCSACIAQKKEYEENGIEYKERDADRLATTPDNLDEVDREAHVKLNMQNMKLPVIVEM